MAKTGKKYIEKIVQVDYTLPFISKEDISRLFIDNLNKLFTVEEITEKIKNLNDSIKNEPFIDFFYSLRDIYRYNNSIKLRLPSIINEVNILDFLLIESLRVFDQKAYQFIIDNKERLVYKSNTNINYPNFQSVKEKSTEEFIESSGLGQLINTILRRLFCVDSSFAYNADSPEDLIRGKRVANSNYFNRYFNLQLSNFDIQEDVFESFINKNSVQENEETLKQIHKKDQLIQFLNWVKIKSKKSDETKQQNIIESILTFSKNLSYKRGMFFGIGSDFNSVLHCVSDMLDSIKNIVLRRELILKHLENNSYFYSFYIADRILNANELLENDKLYSSSEWYYLFKFEKDNDTKFIEKIIAHRNVISKELFDKIIADSDYLAEDEIGIVLDVVYKNYKKHYVVNFSNLIAQDTELVKYLWLSIKRSWMTSGDKIGYQLADYQFFPGLNKEDLKSRIDKFNPDDFNENQNKVIALFQKAYKDGFKEKKFYDIKTLEEIG